MARIHSDVYFGATQLTLLVSLQGQFDWRNPSATTMHTRTDLMRRTPLTVGINSEAAISYTPIVLMTNK